MPTITLGPGAGTTRAYRVQAVYTRVRWKDPWVLAPLIAAVQATWSVAPSIPSATLVYDYGRIKEPGVGGFNDVPKLTVGRRYVRILYVDDAANQWDWVGFFDIDDDSIFGSDRFGGQQKLTAYGIEKILSDHAIDKTVFAEKFAGEVTVKEAVHAGTFNRDGRGNRSDSKAPAPDNAYTFEPNVFDHSNFWNSSQIIEHLLAFHTPRDEAKAIQIPFEFNSANVATWDKPVLPTTQMSTYSLIERLIDRRRLLVWWLEYNGTADVMTWRAASLASSPITLPLSGSPVFPENSNKVDIDFDQDQFTQATIRREFDRYHKVIARGARRVSVGSFSWEDGTLLTGWDLDGSGDRESQYDAGAGASTGYGDLSVDAKQKLNAKARSDPSVGDVYSLWTIPHDWDGEVRNGLGGAKNPLFVGSPDWYYPETFVLPSLPLLVGVDYRGDLTLVEEPEVDAEELPPLVVLQVNGDKWVVAEQLGSAAMAADEGDKKPDWSVSTVVPIDSHGIRMKVMGKPQYFLAYTGLDKPLPEDLSATTGISFFESGIATLAVLDPRYAEGVVDTGEIVDVSRTKILWLGDKYRKVYIAPETVLGVDDDGLLKRSDGGYLHDDTDLLDSVARIAGDYYTIDRRVLDLMTTRLIDSTAIGLGYMVENIGNVAGPHRESINSVVTQIDIQSPMGDTVLEPVEMRITTWAGELDAFQATREAVEREELFGEVTFLGSPGDDPSFDVGVSP